MLSNIIYNLEPFFFFRNNFENNHDLDFRTPQDNKIGFTICHTNKGAPENLLNKEELKPIFSLLKRSSRW